MAGLAYLVVTGLLLQGLVDALNSAYSVRDTKTAEGIHQPTTGLRSGGPGSVIAWDTLGWQGRNFIGKGPSASDIEKNSLCLPAMKMPSMPRSSTQCRRFLRKPLSSIERSSVNLSTKAAR